MNLPESVLLYIFPNGLDLSRQATSLGDGGEKSEEEEMVLTLIPIVFFSFVLQFFHSADAFYGLYLPRLTAPYRHITDFRLCSYQNPLLSKQAIIVLREELEYFFMPPGGKASTDVNGIANESMLDLKRDYGKYLLKKRGASLLHCTATQCQQGEQHCGAASNRHVVHEVSTTQQRRARSKSLLTITR
ncbi:hypothetical protein EDB92DRAFT_1349927 [Lactarius akahatsu]|uniref:Uncharacterized protein n=1 Tax=Lactarius akahatsu TaxID=416441 RepID=A0AAD4L7P3_9AGAM|nr:hypothetical protein EDB92DRAFT_1349927 [Lactarius akahatsu]